MLYATTTRHTRQAGASVRGGFTLVELLVVITLLGLVTAIALPTVTSLFNAGADAQAFNLLSAHLTAARANAIVDNNYVGVHVQQASTKNPLLNGEGFYMGLVERNVQSNHAKGLFRLREDSTPQRLPGEYAFGELSYSYLDDAGNFEHITQDNLPYFTSVTVIFNPNGKVVRNIPTTDDYNPLGRFRTIPDQADSPLPIFQYKGYFEEFYGFYGDDTQNFRTQVWDPTIANTIRDGDNDRDGVPGVTAVTMFDYEILKSRLEESEEQAKDYLYENGQLMPVNIHTGLLYPRK